MPRQIDISTKTIYRALVTTEGGLQDVYGPYSRSANAIDRDRRWRRGRTTVEVQELRPFLFEDAEGKVGPVLEWVTIKTR